MQKYFAFPEIRSGLSLQVYQANIFERKDEYFLDLAETRVVFSSGFKISRKTGVFLYFPMIYINGGFMDGIIDRFHSAFGFPDGGRGEYPYGRVVYYLRDRELSRTGFLPGEPQVFLFYGEKLRIITGFKVPFKNDGFRSGKAWGFLGFSWEENLKGYRISGEHGVASGEGRIFFSRLRITKGRTSAGFLLRTSPYREGDLSHPATAVFLNIRLWKGIHIGLVEDLAPYDTSADFTVFVGLFK